MIYLSETDELAARGITVGAGASVGAWFGSRATVLS
jgi:hypothetical protein